MSVERWLRLIAGVFIILSVVLAFEISRWWLLFNAFIGLNLLQSAFSNWCPMMWLVERLGARSCSNATGSSNGAG